MKKILIVCVALCAVIFFLGRDLNPLDPHLFTFHDNTQASRMQEFAVSLKNGIIPPRLAPDYSFKNGFPVFNFYAPLPYWIGGLFQLIDISSATSLKLVIFLGLLGSFIAFFLFASLYFGFWGGILGASVYSSSLWMAVEIFVRGNVGEIWFIALFPLVLYMLKKNDIGNKNWHFFLSTISLSCLFTVHNVLSLVSVACVLLFTLTLQNKKRAVLSIAVGLLLSSYFLVPALIESKLTYASEIASRTKYSDHFLCVWQLWKADKWSFGGSGNTCFNDDMSFQIGKIHLLLALGGIILFLFQFFRKKEKKKYYFPLGMIIVTLFFAFLMTYLSKPLWDIFAPLVAVFQFPWRFLSFVMFGTAFFAAYLSQATQNKKIVVPLVIILSLSILFSSQKFFFRPWKYSMDEYTSMFLSDAYIQQLAAYQIPEYFPRTGSYNMWRSFDTSTTGFPINSLKYQINTPFYKEIITDKTVLILPIHYFPFWEILINGRVIIPKSFDSLGRPILDNLPTHSTIVVRYNETPIEKFANGITITTFIALIFLCLNKKIWKKINIILK